MSDSESLRENKIKRRGRKCTKANQEGKQYMCPCGKQYYSYPALYTHIKLNHDGHAPGKIIRPQKNDGRVIGASKIDEHNKTIQIGIKTNPIIDLVKILEELPESDSNIKELTQQIPAHIEYRRAAESNMPYHFHSEDNIYDVKLAFGVHLFMQQFEEKVKMPDRFYEMLALMLLLLEFIQDDCEDRNILNEGVIGLMPEYVNYFFVLSYEKMIKSFKFSDYWFSDKENAIRVYDTIFKWMLYKKFTLTTATINSEYLQKMGKRPIDFNVSLTKHRKINQQSFQNDNGDSQGDQQQIKKQANQLQQGLQKEDQHKQMHDKSNDNQNEKQSESHIEEQSDQQSENQDDNKKDVNEVDKQSQN